MYVIFHLSLCLLTYLTYLSLTSVSSDIFDIFLFVSLSFDVFVKHMSGILY